jgi:hypothetical protein
LHKISLVVTPDQGAKFRELFNIPAPPTDTRFDGLPPGTTPLTAPET